MARKPPRRTKPPAEIQRVHDLLLQILEGDIPKLQQLNDETRRAFVIITDTLCWALDHPHDTNLAQLVKDMDAHIAKLGGRQEKIADIPGPCVVCHTTHPPSWPHDLGNAHYRQLFEKQSGRPPTWEDAIYHCTERVQQVCMAFIVRLGCWPHGCSLSKEQMRDLCSRIKAVS